ERPFEPVLLVREPLVDAAHLPLGGRRAGHLRQARVIGLAAAREHGGEIERAGGGRDLGGAAAPATLSPPSPHSSAGAAVAPARRFSLSISAERTARRRCGR